jgi:hypothetical protein
MNRNRCPIYLRLQESDLGHSTWEDNVPLPHQTPLEVSIESARQDDYAGVAVAITNDQWKQRWTSLCLTTPELEVLDGADKETRNKILEKQRGAELWRASDTFGADEVIVSKLGELYAKRQVPNISLTLNFRGIGLSYWSHLGMARA